ncbi:MAG: glutaredoxin family protein [Acidobacteriota bacterium]|nr:glutaredoxin family protein [Acidobacteriota bacterium]
MSQPVKIYTSTWCPDCWRAKSFLKQHGISFQEIKIEEVEGAAEFVIAAIGGVKDRAAAGRRFLTGQPLLEGLELLSRNRDRQVFEQIGRFGKQRLILAITIPRLDWRPLGHLEGDSLTQ